MNDLLTSAALPNGQRVTILNCPEAAENIFHGIARAAFVATLRESKEPYLFPLLFGSDRVNDEYSEISIRELRNMIDGWDERQARPVGGITNYYMEVASIIFIATQLPGEPTVEELATLMRGNAMEADRYKVWAQNATWNIISLGDAVNKAHGEGWHKKMKGHFADYLHQVPPVHEVDFSGRTDSAYFNCTRQAHLFFRDPNHESQKRTNGVLDDFQDRFVEKIYTALRGISPDAFATIGIQFNSSVIGNLGLMEPNRPALPKVALQARLGHSGTGTPG